MEWEWEFYGGVIKENWIIHKSAKNLFGVLCERESKNTKSKKKLLGNRNVLWIIIKKEYYDMRQECHLVKSEILSVQMILKFTHAVFYSTCPFAVAISIISIAQIESR